eukprot:2114471-Rhodomonas_salina.1
MSASDFVLSFRNCIPYVRPRAGSRAGEGEAGAGLRFVSISGTSVIAFLLCTGFVARRVTLSIVLAWRIDAVLAIALVAPEVT